MLEEVLEHDDGGDFITIAGIAKELGRTRQWIHTHPWVLPGPPDVDGKPKKWLREKWDEHKRGLPEAKRRSRLRTK